MTTPPALDTGRAAFDRHDWEAAFTSLRAVDAESALEAGDLERLAEAARWTGRYEELGPLLERAELAYTRRGDARAAARMALALARHNFDQNHAAASRGWWMRAARALEGVPECREHGLLQWMYGRSRFDAGELDAALDTARTVTEIGRRLDEPDLEALGLHDQGHALLARGDATDGLALVDEAMAVAMSGSLGLMTAGTIYCGTIWACRNVGDWARAAEWTDVSIRWCERESVTYFPGLCRFHRAEVMRLRGALEAAERDATAAAAELLVSSPHNAGSAFGELGEIRRRRGDLDGAAEAFRQAVELGYDPQPGLALLRLAHGDASGALRSIERALHDTAVLARESQPSLLPVAVKVAIAAGDLEVARSRCEELERAARAFGTPVFVAGAQEAEGRVALATGDPDRAAGALRVALRAMCELDIPYEAADVRVVLADAYEALGDTHAARAELDAARATFERLGASLDAARLAAPVATARATRTFMFTDIVESTKLVEVLGDDAWDDVLSWHDRTFRSTFATFGGEEVGHAGDGFFVAFPDTAAALDCAIALQRTLRDHRRDHGFAPNVRVGVHAGEAVARDGDFGGRDVHIAARVGALAAAGEILATATTLAGDGGRHPTSDLRPVALKGVAEPVDVTCVEWR